VQTHTSEGQYPLLQEKEQIPAMFEDLSGLFVPPLQLWAPAVGVSPAADPVRVVDAGVELGLLLGLLLGLVEISLLVVVLNVVAVVDEEPAPLVPVGLLLPLVEPTPVAADVGVTGAGWPDPSDGAAEHVFTDKPTVNDARPAASKGSESPSGKVPT
jgi:hypothetical protein